MNHITDRQPKALTWVFLTELWERFAYWALYSLMVLYLTSQLHLSDAKSYLIFSVFNALLYAAPLIGGRIADRSLGATKSVYYGGVWLFFGYALLSLTHNLNMMLISLGALVWGNGLFKPNISTVLGHCYTANDKRREAGFTIYYVGINIGAILGVLGCGWIAMHWSYPTAFRILSLGMLISLGLYFWKLARIEKDLLSKPKLPTGNTFIWVNLSGILIMVLSSCLMKISGLVSPILIAGSVILMVAFFIKSFSLAKEERSGMQLCLLLTTASIAFWALYMQMGSSLMLFTERCINKNLLGYPLSASMISSVNGFWLLLLAPFVMGLWRHLQKRNCEPSTSTKFIIGVFMMGLGYALLILASHAASQNQLISVNWIFGSYGLQTLGELCLSPIGLAMITRLAPARMKSMMMGVWFLATAMASALSGEIAKLAAIPSAAGKTTAVIAQFYQYAFSVDALICGGVVCVLLALLPMMGRLDKGR